MALSAALRRRMEKMAAIGSSSMDEREVDRRFFIVCDSFRSFVITVQGGSRSPAPNT